MRLRVHAGSLGGRGGRMATALEGLALRGHEIVWSDESRGGGGERFQRAGIVVGGGGAPVPAALAGRVAGARVMLLDLRAADLDRWGWFDRWAWDALFSMALIPDEDAGTLAADPRGLARERIGLWPAGPPGATPDAAHPDVEVLERACERALARHQGGAPRAAAFLDRDGTLVREMNYLSDPGSLELLPGVARALRNLSAAGVPLVVISNQAGVGRGLFPEAAVHAVMARLRHLLRAEGVELDAIYFCPHRPDEGCPCRKPGIGLFARAAEDLHLSLAGSVMIGDKRIDAAAGRNAGGRGILVRTGYGGGEEGRTDLPGPAPDHVCDDLGQAVAWWLGPS